MDRHNFRQVHLDFHTSAACGAIAADFDAKTFVKTLKEGRVNTINIFGRCHHGYCYYPTQVGTMHPGLKFDLLGAQIEALHREGIVCPIYLTVKWDDLAGKQHPEWICVRKDGTAAMRPPLSDGWGWTTLDVNSGYGEYFMAIVGEVIERYGKEIDGLWFDICFTQPNYSAWGQEQMLKAGIDLADDRAVWRYARQQDLRFFRKVTDFVKARLPDATYYFNGTTTPEMGEVAPFLTHFEVESLPTTGTWGYLHYPLIARQARTYGKEVIGMTGRFHAGWGDFGGLKTVDQLEYECGTILAAGGKVCVGDQLHPRGVLDPAVYRLIGKAYEKVERLEPWLAGARPTAEAGILALQRVSSQNPGVASYSAGVEGAAQLFLENGIQFDILDGTTDLSAYRMLALPDDGPLTGDMVAKLNAYLGTGGQLITSGTAAYDPQAEEFQLPKIPVQMIGEAPTVPCYLRPAEWMCAGSELAPDYDYAFYEKAYLVKAKAEAEEVGEMRRALFNRTWEHFISHLHAPVGEPLAAPAAVMNEQVLYLAAPLFSGYRRQDYWAYRAMVMGLLSKFFPARVLQPQSPGWVEWSVLEQPKTAEALERSIVFGVAYHPRRTAQPIQHADQSWQVQGLGFRLRAGSRKVKGVYLAPEGTTLDYQIDGEMVEVKLPPVRAYAVAVIEYA